MCFACWSNFDPNRSHFDWNQSCANVFLLKACFYFCCQFVVVFLFCCLAFQCFFLSFASSLISCTSSIVIVCFACHLSHEPNLWNHKQVNSISYTTTKSPPIVSESMSWKVCLPTRLFDFVGVSSKPILLASLPNNLILAYRITSPRASL